MRKIEEIPLREMLKLSSCLAGPAIISNVTVPLLGLSDTFISGHLGAACYIAAIAVGTMMVNALYWLCGFLRMGTTGLTAEAFGASDDDRRRRVLTISLLLAIGIGLAMIIASPLLRWLMLKLLNPPADTADLAAGYFMISILGSPAILSTMALSGWMVGSQNTTYPMIVAISVNVINIVVSFTLVFGLGTGFMGVAYGTLIANWAGLILAFVFARKMAPGRRVLSDFSSLKKNGGLGRFFKVNGNLFIRSACLMSVSFAMTGYASRMGDNALAVNALLMQFFLFFSYFMDGFAFAGEALCGRFAGARERSNLNMAIKALVVWSLVVTVAFTCVYLCFTPQIAGLLTNVKSVIAGVRDIRWVIWILPAISVAAFMFDGVYIGLTDTSRMMIATMVGGILFFLSYYLISFFGEMSGKLPNFMIGIGGLWIAYILFLFVRGFFLALSLRITIAKRFN